MKNRIGIILSIVFIMILAVGGTYAYYIWNSTSDEETKIITSLGAATIYFDGGGAVTKGDLRPTATKEEGIVKTIQVKTTSTGVNDLSFNLYLDITELGENLNEESFRFALYQGSTLRYEGNFSDAFTSANAVACEKNGTTHFKLLENEPISTTLTSYTLYIWVDGLVDNPSTMMQNQSFKFNLHADGQNAVVREGKIPDVAQTVTNSLAYDLVSTYNNAEKTDVTNNGIVYHYYDGPNMMSDIVGNLRYYGSDPDNYIYFNCETYPDTNCEVWRIIGVFEGKVKIMRNSIIGSYSWDTSASGINNGYGINQWGESTYSTDASIYSGADLMKLLNPGYESNQDLDYNGNTITVNNSLYYTGGNGKCYQGWGNNAKDCDFSTMGLKNDITRNLISESAYYLGTGRSSFVYSDEMYEFERGTLTGDSSEDSVNRTTIWTGRVGLPYPSDYGYAADLEICTWPVGSYSDTNCTSNNWMNSILGTSRDGWLITPDSDYSNYAWKVDSSGDIYSGSTSNAQGVAPVLYLNSDVVASKGTGDVNDPYRIKLS